MRFTLRTLVVVSALVVCVWSSSAPADVLGTATVTDANHFGYYGFANTSAQNTKANVGPFTGTARVIRVSGTITQVHPEAWVSSIRVYPRSPALATPVISPMNRFRDTPTSTGYPSATIRSSPASRASECSLRFEKPIPGSRTIAASSTPA